MGVHSQPSLSFPVHRSVGTGSFLKHRALCRQNMKFEQISCSVTMGIVPRHGRGRAPYCRASVPQTIPPPGALALCHWETSASSQQLACAMCKPRRADGPLLPGFGRARGWLHGWLGDILSGSLPLTVHGAPLKEAACCPWNKQIN